MACARKVRIELWAGAIVPIVALLLITGVRFGFLNGITATALFLGSLLAHEGAHALAALLSGTRLRAIGFCLRGAYLRRERAHGATELAISAAGPAANLLLAVWLWQENGILAWLAQMNALLFVINLIPVGGSDGQRILAELRSGGKAPDRSSAPLDRLREDVPGSRL